MNSDKKEKRQTSWAQAKTAKENDCPTKQSSGRLIAVDNFIMGLHGGTDGI
jgi:hypothetical protein